MLGLGNAFVALGFNEPLTMTQRWYGLEKWTEDMVLIMLARFSDAKVRDTLACISHHASMQATVDVRVLMTRGDTYELRLHAFSFVYGHTTSPIIYARS